MLFTHIPNTQYSVSLRLDWSMDRRIDRPTRKSKNQPKKRTETQILCDSRLVFFCFLVFNYLQKSWLRELSFIDNCDLLSVSVACLGRTGALFVAAVSFHCVPKALLACACFACFLIDDADRLQLSNWLKMLDFTVHSMYLRAKYVSVWVCECFFFLFVFLNLQFLYAEWYWWI